jgi:hypothetical protein
VLSGAGAAIPLADDGVTHRVKVVLGPPASDEASAPDDDR